MVEVWKTLILLVFCVAFLGNAKSTEMTAAGEEKARFLWQRYNSIPKGVTAEGIGFGLGEVKTATYDPQTNQITIDDGYVYSIPIPREEVIELAEALLKDDRIGVSLTAENRVIVYGALSKKSALVQAFHALDQFLSGVVYGMPKYYAGQKLPGDYQPIAIREEKIPTACCFAFQNFVFQKYDDTKRIKRIALALDVLQIPLAKQRAPDGGHLPDMAVLEKGGFGEESKVNLNHLRDNIDEYLKLPIVARATAIAEAAVFLRTLKENSVKLEEIIGQAKSKDPLSVNSPKEKSGADVAPHSQVALSLIHI